MTFRYIIFLPFLSGLTACNKASKIHFVINNQTSDVMDSVKITPNNDAAGLYRRIMPNEVGDYYADLSGQSADGSYTLSYKRFSAGKHVTRQFGYFSNGQPLEKQLFLEVWLDTLIVKSSLEAF